MKKTTLKIVLPIIIVVGILSAIIIILFINNSSPEKKIQGHWVLTEESKEDYYQGNYISKELIFFDNGKYSDGSWQGSYSINDNFLSMTYVFDSYTYTYFIEGDRLALKDSREGSNYIYYVRPDD